MGNQIDGVLPGEFSRFCRRHCVADLVCQTRQRELAPHGQEIVSDQRRPDLAAKSVAMAGRAILSVNRLTSFGLRFGVYALTYILCLSCLKCENARKNSDSQSERRRHFRSSRV
jgi:hypothetical protein